MKKSKEPGTPPAGPAPKRRRIALPRTRRRRAAAAAGGNPGLQTLLRVTVTRMPQIIVGKMSIRESQRTDTQIPEGLLHGAMGIGVLQIRIQQPAQIGRGGSPLHVSLENRVTGDFDMGLPTISGHAADRQKSEHEP